MRPDNQAKNDNRHDRIHHGGVTEQRLPRVDGKDLADQPESRQNHDVNGWVRIEPEQMLVNNDIAAESGIEESCVRNDVKAEQDKCACQNRRRQHHQNAGAEHGPAIHRQLHQFQTWTPQFQNCCDEIDSAEDGTSSQKQNTKDPENLACSRRCDAQWGVGRPA